MNVLAYIYLLLTILLGISAALALPFPLPRWVKVLIGPALGIIISTQLALVISLVFGFNKLSIFFSLLLFFLIVLKLCIKLKFSLNAHTGSGRIKFLLRGDLINFFKSNWPLLLICLTIGTLVIFVFWFKILAPSEFGLVTGGGGLYGDTAMHSAFTMSLVEQGLPPTNPLFAGQPLIYPFLINFFSALLVKIGMSLRFAFILPQMAFFFGFVTLFYILTKKFTTNLGSLLSMLIFFLGWGWGFAKYLQKVASSGVWSITQEYTNNLPGFHMHNVLTGLIFPERSFLPGLFIGLLIISFFIPPLKLREGQGELCITKLQAVTIGFLLGFLPLWHTHTFIFISLGLGFWIAYSMSSSITSTIFNIPILKDLLAKFAKKAAKGKNEKSLLIQRAKALTLMNLTAFFISLPIFHWFSKSISHDSFIHFSLGWINSGKKIVWFWMQNSGLLIPLALIGVVLLSKKSQNQWLFFLPAFLMFILANFIVFQPWDWDNIKLFSWVFLFFSILAGAFLSQSAQKNIIFSLLSLITLLSLTTSGILSVIHQLSTTYGIYSHEDLQLAEWIKQNTSPKDVFLVNPWPNHPVPGLTGRSVYMGYPGHLWVHGIEYGEREALVNKILTKDIQTAGLSKPPVDYIITLSSQRPNFPLNYALLVTEIEKYTVFETLP